jgi:hypothetical protein
MFKKKKKNESLISARLTWKRYQAFSINVSEKLAESSDDEMEEIDLNEKKQKEYKKCCCCYFKF